MIKYKFRLFIYSLTYCLLILLVAVANQGDAPGLRPSRTNLFLDFMGYLLNPTLGKFGSEEETSSYPGWIKVSTCGNYPHIVSHLYQISHLACV